MIGASVNHLAVFVAALSAFLLGAAFHLRSPRATTSTGTYDVPPRPEVRLLFSALGALIAAYALAFFFRLTDVGDPGLGLFSALLIWFGFVLSHAVQRFFNERASLRGLLIEMSDKAVEYAVMGLILGAWR